MPACTRSIGSGTPITPVDATATAPRRDARHAAAAWRMLAACSSPGTPVAALALPELTTTARRPSQAACSMFSSTGAASVPERVKRAALVVRSEAQTSSPRSRRPLGLIPQATPPALKP